MITETLLNLLVCPKCKNSVHLTTQLVNSNGEILDGFLECAACGIVYPVKNGIPKLLVLDEIQVSNLQNDKFRLWEDKQQIYIAWVKKTWDGSPRAEALTESGRKLLRKFIEFGQPFGRILDVGCGGGSISPFIPHCDYMGIDPIPREVRFPFVQAMGEYLPFKDECFDTIIINGVLDHVMEPPKVLGEIRRCLKIQGHILVSNTISHHRTRLQTILMLSRQGLKRLWLRDIPGLIRGIRVSLGITEEEFHLHHYTIDSLVELIDEYFGNVHSLLVDGNRTLFIKGSKVIS